jgi:hypothetical protein
VLYKIEREMKQLNSYCAYTLLSTDRKNNEFRKQIDNIKSGKKVELEVSKDIYNIIEDDNSGEFGHVLEELEIDVENWEENLSFIAPAMTLVLLHIFVEKSLRSICIEFHSSKNPTIKKESDESVIQSYIRFLNHECKLNFSISDDILTLQNECRIIRNRFAHGDWKTVNEKIQNINLVETFYSVTKMFETIEESLPGNKTS